MKLKKTLLCLLLFFILWVFSYPVHATEEPTTYSPACLLMDMDSGKILYEKNMEKKRYPASTTKIMTAILALENCDLSEKAAVSHNAVYSIPSGYTTASIQVGEEFTIEQMLYALLLPSANDAAVVIAEHISGSVEEFAKLMNEKAKEIGCKNTHFVNPNGIQNEDHYSTAYDLALMGRYAMQNETFRNIVATTSYTLPATEIYDKEDRILVTTNDLIRSSLKDTPGNYYYPYANGIKTGYTSPAGNCIVASAEKDGAELLVVVLGAGQTDSWESERYLDCISLFDYGFESYTSQTLTEENEVLQQIKIAGATSETKNPDVLIQDQLKALVPSETSLENIEPTITLQENLKAPLSKGTTVGKITYHIDGIEYSSNLILGENVEKSSFWVLLFRILLIVFILYIIIRLLKSLDGKKKRKKYKRLKYYEFK